MSVIIDPKTGCTEIKGPLFWRATAKPERCIDVILAAYEGTRFTSQLDSTGKGITAMQQVRRAIAPCPKCNEAIWNEHSGPLCPRCGEMLPEEIRLRLPRLNSPSGGDYNSARNQRVPFAPKYCPHCGAALAPDAKFCTSCRWQVSYAAAIASELRDYLKSSVQSFLGEESNKVPRLIWAVVIQFFWLFIDITTLLGAVAGSAAVGMAGAVSRSASSFGVRTGPTGIYELLAVALVLVSLVQVSFDGPLIFGFFAQKRWVHGLYMWSCLPRCSLALIGLLLVLASGVQSGSLEIAPFFMLVAMALLLWLQISLVRKSKAELAS